MSDMKYEQLRHEVQSIKVELATMSKVANTAQLLQERKAARGKSLINIETNLRSSDPILPTLDYTVDEMLT